MLDVNECELANGTIVPVHTNAQVGPGVGIEYIDEFTIRIYFSSDDIPTVYSPGQYDLYYVDFDTRTKTCGIAHSIDLISDFAFNTSHHDQGPIPSVDGQYMTFLWEGPAGSHDHEIWIVEKNAVGLWSNPRRLPNIVNSGHDEHNGMLRDGKLYFSSNNRDGLGGDFDLWMCDYDPVTNTATNLEKLYYDYCPEEQEPPTPPTALDTTLYHDALSANTHSFFQWHDSGVAWSSLEDGYISGVVNSWYESIISESIYDPDDNPYLVLRFYCGLTNHISGFTDNPPETNNHHYSNVDLGIYIHSTGTIRPSWDVNNAGYWNKTVPNGFYDVKIALNGAAGTVTIILDDVASYDAPLSDFSDPVWSTVENRPLSSAYHIQSNPYSPSSHVHDIWAKNGKYGETTGGGSTAPVTTYTENDPWVSADGSRLYMHVYFLPGAQLIDIAYCDRVDCGDGTFTWSEPMLCDGNVNGPGAERHPVITEDGRFMFINSYSDPSPGTVTKLMYCEKILPEADIYGTVTDVSLGAPASDIPVSIYEVVSGGNILVGEEMTAVDGTYSFTDLNPGTYLVEAAAPFGYAVSPESHTVILDGTDVFSVDFDLTVTIADISGSVTDIASGDGAYGILVALYQEINEEHVLVDDVLTSSDGTYDFDNLAPGTYVVEAVAPIGFIVDPDNHTVILNGADVSGVDFGLSALSVTNNSRGKGYWKHQVNVVIKGKGRLHEEEDDITTNFPALVFSNFYGGATLPVQIEGVTYALVDGNAAALSVTDMQATLSSGKNMTMLDKSRMHYLALLLNVVSMKVGQSVVISSDGIKVSQAIVYIDELIAAGSESDLELAKDIAESINEGVEIASGVIPDSTPMVYYERSSRPAMVTLDQNYPNPFNPSTSIMFNMDKSGTHHLAVYDVNGRLVKVLSSGQISADPTLFAGMVQTVLGPLLLQPCIFTS